MTDDEINALADAIDAWRGSEWDDEAQEAATALRSLLAERDEARANLNVARSDGHHDGYRDGCQASQGRADALQRRLNEAERERDMLMEAHKTGRYEPMHAAYEYVRNAIEDRAQEPSP